MNIIADKVKDGVLMGFSTKHGTYCYWDEDSLSWIPLPSVNLEDTVTNTEEARSSMERS